MHIYYMYMIVYGERERERTRPVFQASFLNLALLRTSRHTHAATTSGRSTQTRSRCSIRSCGRFEALRSSACLPCKRVETFRHVNMYRCKHTHTHKYMICFASRFTCSLVELCYAVRLHPNDVAKLWRALTQGGSTARGSHSACKYHGGERGFRRHGMCGMPVRIYIKALQHRLQ